MRLPNDVSPGHESLQESLPGEAAAHNRGDDTADGEDKDHDTQNTTLQRLDAEQAEDTCKEHDKTRSHRDEGADGREGSKIQGSQALDEGQRCADTPDDVDDADEDRKSVV